MRHYPPSPRQLRAQKDRRGFLILGTSALIVTAGGVALTYARTSARDQTTSCLQGQMPDMQTYVIVDRTDPWADAQTALLRAALTGIARGIKTEERLTLIPFDGPAGQPAALLFDSCKMPDGSVTNILFKNPARAGKAYQEHFAKPLEATLAVITKPARAKETHLVAFLSGLADQIKYEARASKTRIVVFSDLAENTPALSLYAKAKSQVTADSFSRYFTGLVRDHLSGIELEIFQMPLPSRSPELEKRIKNAWSTALTNNAIGFSIRDF